MDLFAHEIARMFYFNSKKETLSFNSSATMLITFSECSDLLMSLLIH